MGQQSTKVPATTRTFEQVHHPPLNIRSEVSVLVDEQNSKIIEYTSVIESRTNCKRWEEQIKEYFAGVDTTMFYLPLRYHYVRKQYCGSAGTLHVHYEYLPTTLFREIIGRMERRYKFGEGDMWRLLYTYCAAASELYSKAKKLGKIGLESLFLNLATKQIKIATGLTFLSDCIIQEIIAPECLSNRKFKADPLKQEAFCIGIVVLCSMLLIPKAPFTQDNFDADSVAEMLNQLRNDTFYSLEIKDIVSRMCSIQPQNRSTAPEVYNRLQTDSKFMDFYRNSDNKGIEEQVRPTETIFNTDYATEQISRKPEQSIESTWRIPQRPNNLVVPLNEQPQTQSYSNLFALIDQQLEKSRKSFPS